MPLITVTRLLE